MSSLRRTFAFLLVERSGAAEDGKVHLGKCRELMVAMLLYARRVMLLFDN